MAKIGKSDLIFYILIISFAILIRIFYFIQNSNIIVSADTYGYYDAGQRFYSGKSIIDPSRGPVYPLIIALPAFLNSRINTPVLSPAFFMDMQTITLLQMVFSILTFIALYRLLLWLDISPLYSFFFVFFIIFNISNFASDNTLMTESITANLTVIIVCIQFLILKKFNLKFFYLLGLLCSIIFLLKPVYILFPIIPAVITVFYHKSKKVILHSLAVIIFFYISVFLYIRLNTLTNDFRGISRITDYNLLGIIMIEDLNTTPAKNNLLYDKLQDYKKTGKEMMPFRFMEFINPLYYRNNDLLDQVHNFNSVVLRHNFPEFIYKSLLKIPHAIIAKNESYVFAKNSHPLSLFFTFLYDTYNYLQLLNLIIIPGFIYLLIKTVKIQSIQNIFWIFISSISLYQIFFSAFFSYGEYGRLIYPAQTFIYLFSFYCWGKLLRKFGLPVLSPDSVGTKKLHQ